MKKIVFLVFMAIIGVCCLFANNDNRTDFVISAYKTKNSAEGFLELNIYDALSGSLKIIKDGARLELTEYTDGLLGSTSGKEPNFTPSDKHVVFSFHINGNEGGAYTVAVNIQPLTLNSDSTEKKYISTRYSMMSITGFYNNSNSISGLYGGRITRKTGNSNEPIISDIPTDASSESNLKLEWDIEEGTQKETWKVQCSVGMILNMDEYKNAENGLYEAAVKLTLQVNK